MKRSVYLMRRTVPFALALLLIACAGGVPREEGEGKHFLWRVRSKDSTVFLLGSIHVAKKDLYPLASPIEKAFEASETLVVEANLVDLQSKAVGEKLLSRARYPMNESLRRNLSSETYVRTDEQLQKIGMRIEQMDRFKPWLVSMILMSEELQRLGFDPRYGIDLYFLQKAHGVKQIQELESLEEQIRLFDSFSRREQELFLQYTLMDLKRIEGQMEVLFRSWREGDARTLRRVMMEGFTDRPELISMYERLVTERNLRMVSRIKEFLRAGRTTFVVVGAGHLVGEEGILHQLQGKGFSIEQL